MIPLILKNANNSCRVEYMVDVEDSLQETFTIMTIKGSGTNGALKDAEVALGLDLTCRPSNIQEFEALAVSANLALDVIVKDPTIGERNLVPVAVPFTITTNGAQAAGKCGVKEVTNCTLPADVHGSLGGKYFEFDTVAKKYYTWFKTTGMCEATDITCGPDVAGSLNDTYFLFDTPATNYYVWFNINAAGTDPAIAGRTGIEVAGATGITANNLATALRLALTTRDGIDHTFAVTGATSHAIITNRIAGAVQDAVDTGSTGFTIAIVTQGVNVGSDPAVAGRTGIEVDITTEDVANSVATATRAALTAQDVIDTSMVITGATSHAIITDRTYGAVTDAVDTGTSGTTFVITQGKDGTLYSLKLAAAGGNLASADYVWTITNGAQPTGLSIIGSYLYGVPTAPSNPFTFKVTATDSFGVAVQSGNLTIVVTAT